MRYFRFRSLPAALAVSLLCSSFAAPPARAAEGPIKIAVITDMSGVYAALAGPGAVEATKMAVRISAGRSSDGRSRSSRSTTATTAPRLRSKRAKRTTAVPTSRST
jgi:hypothetical protein